MPDPNVIAFTGRAGGYIAPPEPATERALVAIPLNLDVLPGVMVQLGAVLQIMDRWLQNRGELPDERVINGISQILTAFNNLVASM